MRTILALVDASLYAGSVCDLAAWAAGRSSARVSLLHVLGRREVSGAPVDLSGSLRADARERLLAELAAHDEARGRLEGLYEADPSNLHYGLALARAYRDMDRVEDALQNARRYYNATVRELNTRIAQFPSNIVAGIASVRPREFFEIEAPEEREAPRVEF